MRRRNAPSDISPPFNAEREHAGSCDHHFHIAHIAIGRAYRQILVCNFTPHAIRLRYSVLLDKRNWFQIVLYTHCSEQLLHSSIVWFFSAESISKPGDRNCIAIMYVFWCISVRYWSVKPVRVNGGYIFSISPYDDRQTYSFHTIPHLFSYDSILRSTVLFAVPIVSSLQSWLWFFAIRMVFWFSVCDCFAFYFQPIGPFKTRYSGRLCFLKLSQGGPSGWQQTINTRRLYTYPATNRITLVSKLNSNKHDSVECTGYWPWLRLNHMDQLARSNWA